MTGSVPLVNRPPEGATVPVSRHKKHTGGSLKAA
jgi:hypothetical protein